uniref:hypothetical protein n=1 Tax=Nitrospira cf. moscoviensis SBR1015 TaxID=96242 RepID=UPI00117FE4BB|nr:hypothetical protein [Nitrospira cf. moscoviensis SBR1015]
MAGAHRLSAGCDVSGDQEKRCGAPHLRIHAHVDLACLTPAVHGDHHHYGRKEASYVFSDPDKLIADFQADIGRWNHESRDP